MLPRKRETHRVTQEQEEATAQIVDFTAWKVATECRRKARQSDPLTADALERAAVRFFAKAKENGGGQRAGAAPSPATTTGLPTVPARADFEID